MKKTSTIFMLAFVCFLFMIPIICYVFKLPDISGFAVAATISGFFFAFADLLASESQIWKADMERCGVEASKMEDFLRRTLQIYGEMERKLEPILAIAKHPTYNLEHQEYDDYEKLYCSVKRVQSSAYDLLYNKKGKEKNLNLSESQYKLTVRWSKVMLFVGIIALLSLLIIDSIAPIFEQSQSIYSIYGCAFITVPQTARSSTSGLTIRTSPRVAAICSSRGICEYSPRLWAFPVPVMCWNFTAATWEFR